MAGHVDDADARAAGQVEVGVTEVDGDAAPFFLFQGVGVDAGQGLDKPRLAVVDMTGGAEDQMFQFIPPSPACFFPPAS
jgi:hypothetical protein